MDDLLSEVSAIEDEIIAIRRDLHMHPELAFEEHRTAVLIADRLHGLGLEVQTGVAKTGVVGLLRGNRPGKTIAIRADMDALPQQEERDVPYASKVPGVHHGCGHDAHVAMALGTAMVLADLRDQLAGNIKFLFEPAEERVTGDFIAPVGARLMVEEGALEDPTVDALISLHVRSNLEIGHIAIKRGMAFSGWDVVDIVILGRETHASEVEKGVDAITVAAQVVCALQTLVTRSLSITEPCSIHIGAIRGGRSRSIVADRVEMDGALRCSNLELRRHLRTKIEQLVTGITEAYGASYEIEYIDYLHPIVNSPELADLVYEAIAATLGPGKVRWLEHPRMSGDSFFHYSERVPCVYAQLGSGNSELRTNYPPHHPLFDIDESCMASGVAAYCAIVLRFLASKER